MSIPIKYDYHKTILGYFTHITTFYCLEILHQTPQIYIGDTYVLNHINMLSCYYKSLCQSCIVLERCEDLGIYKPTDTKYWKLIWFIWRLCERSLLLVTCPHVSSNRHIATRHQQEAMNQFHNWRPADDQIWGCLLVPPGWVNYDLFHIHHQEDHVPVMYIHSGVSITLAVIGWDKLGHCLIFIYIYLGRTLSALCDIKV